MKINLNSALIIVIAAAVIFGIPAIFGLFDETGGLAQQAAVYQGPAKLTLLAPAGKAVTIGQPQTVTWTSGNGQPSKVTINIIRKVSDNPASYELVRTIASDTANDGKAVWIPNEDDAGFNVSLEVACGDSNEACEAADSVSAPLAVVNGGNVSNTASAYEALERALNR